MSWIQLKLKTSNDIAEALSDFLEELGAVSVTFQDSFDTPVFEPLPGETKLWGNTDVIGLFESDVDIDFINNSLSSCDMFNQISDHQFETLEDKAWEREWMDNFHPMQFGQRLWICPSWREIPDPSAVNVMLDPGLAFGTGTHPTTALCLTWLDGQNLEGKTVIDYGCGSGILAISALKLGAKRAIGIDIDPQALQASKENAKRNGVDDKLELYLANNEPKEAIADVVVANILAGPLTSLEPKLTLLLMKNGQLGLSGILSDQSDQVMTAYQKNIDLDLIKIVDEWCLISGVKK